MSAATKAKGKTKAALEAGRKGVGEVAGVSLYVWLLEKGSLR